MVNSAGMIHESIWRDKDFRALPRTAQCMYLELLSQKELDRAGIQPLLTSKWAKGCDEITEGDVWRELGVLHDSRFIVFDTETDELFVRSYMRQSNVAKQPNLMKNALKCALMVASGTIRQALAVELRRLGRMDAIEVASTLDGNPSGTLPDAFRKGSEYLNHPVDNPVDKEPFRNPSRTPLEPRGVGEGVGEGSVSSGLSKEGALACTATRPNPHCSKHPNGTDRPCTKCKRARESAEQWDSNQIERERATKAAAASVRRDCPDCDDLGWLLDTEPARRCTHGRGAA